MVLKTIILNHVRISKSQSKNKRKSKSKNTQNNSNCLPFNDSLNSGINNDIIVSLKVKNDSQKTPLLPN